MKRSPGASLVRLIAAFGLAIAGLLALAPAAAAEGEDWAVTKYAMAVQVAEDGTAKISLDFDFDFGNEEGHGPYLLLPSRQEIPGDSEHWRSFPIELGVVTSSTGAPTDTDTETSDGLLAVRIGDDNKEVSGLQSYHVEYSIRGLVNPRAAGSGLDELNWNVISGWKVPLQNVSITVNGPAGLSAVECFAGEAGSQQQCGASRSGNGSQFSAPEVPEGQGMTIVAGWPGGTFVGAEPILTKRHHLGNTFTANPITVGGGALIAALGTGGLAALARRRGRDERFAGLTPGLIPAAGTEGAATTVGGSSGPVAVRFTPPDDARPGEVGALIDEKAQQRDVTATVIDLAVRGHLRIAEVEPEPGSKLPGGKDWELTRLGGSDQLRGYESAALNGLFDKGSPIRMTEAMAGLTKAAVPAKLLADVTERGWFKANPGTVRGLWILAGCGIVVLGGIVTAVLAATIGWGIVGLGIVLLGVMTFVFAGRMPARTATGTAMLDQAKGFRLYLETAEADQLKFEEGEDLFSRYLPYAIVFGVADRWAKIFADLAARGHDVPQPDWYVGPYLGAAAFYGSGGFSSSLDAFSSASSAAMTAASSGSGGGSGFGGGGSVGGGVGGGGGGGW
ncbi:DUF2207 domain-containing protein [Microlunatus parietis]|uniref:Putative membrane protein YgcG n=1 Tax=Microlunatus parietis TaxID=682979 RepID=A0A7Y9I6I6_9ACTN|nr:DUF2207 domain-containing protein [Microlunatus parietis]NYE71199.1 putative membrane protein YgcG [Microlunatus parietis]